MVSDNNNGTLHVYEVRYIIPSTQWNELNIRFYGLAN